MNTIYRMAYRAQNSLTSRLLIDGWQDYIQVTIGTTFSELKNWADDYHFITTPTKLWMASTDQLNDVGREILIEGIVVDDTGKWVTDGEILALHAVDARIPVQTVKEYIRVNCEHVQGIVPLTGIISLANEDFATWSAGSPGTGSNRVGYIDAGQKNSQRLIFSTPSDINGRILEVTAHGGIQAGDMQIEAAEEGYGFVAIDVLSFESRTQDEHFYQYPLRILPKSDMRVMGKTDTGSGSLYGRIAMVWIN